MFDLDVECFIYILHLLSDNIYGLPKINEEKQNDTKVIFPMVKNIKIKIMDFIMNFSINISIIAEL